MQLSIFFDLTGRLHPVIVHLPIGILLIACLFELLSSRERYASLRPSIRLLVFWGMIAAILSVISGLILSGNGEYEDELVDPHEWFGIATAITSIIFYVLYRFNSGKRMAKIFSIVVFLMVIVTGHLGGSVTRGPEYLIEPFTGIDESVVHIKPIPDIQKAVLYADVVQPILEARCYNCHGPRRHRGKLRLDEKEMIIKGGKNGKIFVAGKPDSSEMIERLMLPLDHDDHMPPKGKPQLTRQQKDVLYWWVSTGADFSKKVSELKQTAQIRSVLLAFQEGSAPMGKELTELPGEKVAPADSAVIRKLIAAGVMVLPVARNTNYLSANFVSVSKRADSLLKQLRPLTKQLISLKLDGAQLHDSSIAALSEYFALRNLQLSNTAVTDQGLSKLIRLKDLHSLNLVGTMVTAKGVVKLKELKDLKNLYLYGTRISAAEQMELKKNFPATNLDFGNYSLPMLATDTTVVKY